MYLTRLIGLEGISDTEILSKEADFLSDKGQLDVNTGKVSIKVNNEHELAAADALASFINILFNNCIKDHILPEELTFITYPINFPP